jgi:hypothetical protein
MFTTTNIDKLVEDFIFSTYDFKKTSYGHDMMFRKGSRNHDNMNGMEIMTEIKLIFEYDALKTFNLVNKWAHNNYPDILLFEFWKQNKYLIDKLPDYMKEVIIKNKYDELYQDFYFDIIDS